MHGGICRRKQVTKVYERGRRPNRLWKEKDLKPDNFLLTSFQVLQYSWKKAANPGSVGAPTQVQSPTQDQSRIRP